MTYDQAANNRVSLVFPWRLSRCHIPIIPENVGQIAVRLIRCDFQRHLPVELGRHLAAVQAAHDDPAPPADLRQQHAYLCATPDRREVRPLPKIGIIRHAVILIRS